MITNPNAATLQLEQLDNTPVQLPTRLKIPQNRTEQIRNYIRQELSRQASEQQSESFEDADDFDLEDGEDNPTAYELADLEPPHIPAKQGEGEAPPPVVPAATSEVPATTPPPVV